MWFILFVEGKPLVELRPLRKFSVGSTAYSKLLSLVAQNQFCSKGCCAHENIVMFRCTWRQIRCDPFSTSNCGSLLRSKAEWEKCKNSQEMRLSRSYSCSHHASLVLLLAPGPWHVPGYDHQSSRSACELLRVSPVAYFCALQIFLYTLLPVCAEALALDRRLTPGSGFLVMADYCGLCGREKYYRTWHQVPLGGDEISLLSAQMGAAL